ncbi:transposase domain-containing protein, partial [Treponema sp.]|uniref:transposase domain-containing protein n=1 Tax=Treponema sp. TaxID=166 RepID=UPI003FD6CC05
RTVRPFTLLRKNSLFYGSGKGAESRCWILTLIETAKIHNLSPEDYLRCVFERAPYCETTEDWQKLLPWNIKITPFQPQG